MINNSIRVKNNLKRVSYADYLNQVANKLDLSVNTVREILATYVKVVKDSVQIGMSVQIGDMLRVVYKINRSSGYSYVIDPESFVSHEDMVKKVKNYPGLSEFYADNVAVVLEVYLDLLKFYLKEGYYVIVNGIAYLRPYEDEEGYLDVDIRRSTAIISSKTKEGSFVCLDNVNGEVRVLDLTGDHLVVSIVEEEGLPIPKKLAIK